METVTYTKMDYREFDQLCYEHLGIDSFDGMRDGKYVRAYSLQQDLEMNQDSHLILDPEMFEDETAEWYKENYSVTYKYMKQLLDKGVIPKDHHIFIEVWW
jgi:hypothetical protein